MKKKINEESKVSNLKSDVIIPEKLRIRFFLTSLNHKNHDFLRNQNDFLKISSIFWGLILLKSRFIKHKILRPEKL